MHDLLCIVFICHMNMEIDTVEQISPVWLITRCFIENRMIK